jgi:hypothetical protein
MTPLPDAVSILLRTSAAAAMAALLLISVSHPDLFAWANEAIAGEEPASLPPKANHLARRAHKANGAVLNPTFGHVDPTTHVSTPTRNGSVYPGDCLTWGLGITDAGVVCGGGGGGGGGPLTIYTTHSGLVNNVTTPTEARTVVQQGFYSPGDGGDATYQWNFTSYCPSGVAKAPVAADGIACVLPIGQSASTPGRYLLSVSGDFNARAAGLLPGGQDNSPYVKVLMNAVSYLAGPFANSHIVFPPVAGQAVTFYYFSQPFILSRALSLDCKTTGIGGYGGSILAFAPGIDGVIQESGNLSPDTGWGNSEINGCSINSLGGGGAIGAIYPLQSATVTAGGSGYGSGTGTGTMTWSLGGYCPIPPVLNVTTVGGVVTAINSIATPGSCHYDLSRIAGWTAGGGLNSAGTGFTANVKLGIVSTGNSVTNIYLNPNLANWGVNNWTFPTDCNALSGEYECKFGVGDGIVIMGSWIPTDGQLAVAPGAYVATSNPSAKTVTLASPYTILNILNSRDIAVWDLPAKEKYTVQTTTGSNAVTVTAGPASGRLIKAGDMIWSDAFLFGSTVLSAKSSLVGTPTVNAGGSGYVGTSGTMTWSGPGCLDGYNQAPVLNVTASGGVITGVTGVASAGICLQSNPSSSATTWTPGGGLSGGSGASFHMTFNQALVIRNVTFYQNANATVTYASGSPGQLWTLPAGVIRRAGARMKNSIVNAFTVDLRLDCHSAMYPLGGCNDSFDEENVLNGALVGRLVRGNNSGVSTSVGNTYAGNSIADIVEAASIGSSYLSESNNSQDGGTSIYGTLVVCGGQNFSNFIGSYLSGQDHGPCLGYDAQGNINIGVKADDTAVPSELFVGSVYGLGNIAAGSFNAPVWSFGGRSVSTQTATVATASGTVIAVPTNSSYYPGLAVTDLTNPVIPANTTIVSMLPNSITISSALTGSGIRIGDQIQFSNRGGPCIDIHAGLGNAGMQFDTACAHGGLGIGYNGYYGGWGINAMLMPDDNYRGYNGGDLRLPIFANGLQLGNGSDYIGQERVLDGGSGPPATAWHLQGDIRLNQRSAPGGNLAWTNTQVASTTLSANVVGGTTTSVAVAACPNPALAAGTPVIDATGTGAVAGLIDLSLPLGTLASCTSTTLTLQAAATNSGASGHTIQFLEWRPAAPIADDTAGKSWTLGNYMTLTPVALASLPATCTAGTFAVINNGVASPTYNAAVGSTTGAATDPVFCTNGNVWKYH